jgi:hypothetical protein
MHDNDAGGRSVLVLYYLSFIVRIRGAVARLVYIASGTEAASWSRQSARVQVKVTGST